MNVFVSGYFELSRNVTTELKEEIKKFLESKHSLEDGFPSYYCPWYFHYGDNTIGCEDGGDYNGSFAIWLQYIIDNFFVPNDIDIVDDELVYEDAENWETFGLVGVKDDKVYIRRGHREYNKEECYTLTCL